MMMNNRVWNHLVRQCHRNMINKNIYFCSVEKEEIKCAILLKNNNKNIISFCFSFIFSLCTNYFFKNEPYCADFLFLKPIIYPFFLFQQNVTHIKTNHKK